MGADLRHSLGFIAKTSAVLSSTVPSLLCTLHVHQPSIRITGIGTKLIIGTKRVMNNLVHPLISDATLQTHFYLQFPHN